MQQQQQQQSNGPSTSGGSGALSPSPSVITQTSTGSANAAAAAAPGRIQLLKQRKLDLDRVLHEKTQLLQQLCRQEAQIIGIYPNAVDVPTSSSFHGLDKKLQVDAAAATAATNTTLRRKVGTGFRLPENMLRDGVGGGGGGDDALNRLLLVKQIQQQISEASLRLANDAMQTKSIRRTHKQNYEAAQMKLQSINQSLVQLKKRHDAYAATQLNNNNLSGEKLQQNNELLERRNSMISSHSMHLAAAATTPILSTSPIKQSHRIRHDSYTGEYVVKHASSPSYQQPPQYHQPPPPPQPHQTEMQQFLDYNVATLQHAKSVKKMEQQQHQNQPEQYYEGKENHPQDEYEAAAGTSMRMIQQQAGLGGYWMTLDNNERVWCSVDTRYVF